MPTMDELPLLSPTGLSPKNKHSPTSPEKKRPSLENLVATLHLKAQDSPLKDLEHNSSDQQINGFIKKPVLDSSNEPSSELHNQTKIQNGHLDLNMVSTLPSNGPLKTISYDLNSSLKVNTATPISHGPHPLSLNGNFSSSSNSEDNSSSTVKPHTGLFLDSESSQDDIGMKVSNAVASILPQLDHEDIKSPSSNTDKTLWNGNHPSIEFVNDEPRLSFFPCREAAKDTESQTFKQGDQKASLAIEERKVGSNYDLADGPSASEVSNGTSTDSNANQMNGMDSEVLESSTEVMEHGSTDQEVSETTNVSSRDVSESKEEGNLDVSPVKSFSIDGNDVDGTLDDSRSCLSQEINGEELSPEIEEGKQSICQMDLSIYTKQDIISSDLFEAECLERVLLDDGQPFNECQIHKYANGHSTNLVTNDRWKSITSLSTSLCNIKLNTSMDNRCSTCSQDVANLVAHNLQRHCCLSFVPVVETRSFFHHLAERSVEFQELYNEESYGSPIYLCKECGNLGKSIGEARLHLNLHNTVYTIYIGNGDCKCHLELMKFINPVNALVHCLRNSLECGYCSIRLSCAENLEKHKQLAHKQKIESTLYELPPHDRPEEIRDQTCYSWIALDNFTNYLDGKLFRLYSVGSDKYSSLYDGSPNFPKDVIPQTIEVPSKCINSPSNEMTKYLNSKFRWKYSHTEIDQYIEHSFDCAVQMKFQEKFTGRKQKSSKIGRKPVPLLASCDLVQINPSTVKSDDSSCRRSKRISQVTTEFKEPVENVPDLSRTRSKNKIGSTTETVVDESPKGSENVTNEPEVKLSGEWDNEFTFVCCSCGNSYQSLADIMDHKWDDHPMVWCAHTMYKGTDLPPMFCKQYRPTNISTVAEGSSALSRVGQVNKKKRLLTCTSCGINLLDLPSLHAHIVECGGLNRFVSHKKRNKKGSKFRRRTGQGIPSSRYANLNGTPNKTTSNGGSGVSTPQKDSSFATSKTILNVKKKLEVDVSPSKTDAALRVSRQQKFRNLPRCGAKRRFRMRLRRKVSQSSETATKKKKARPKPRERDLKPSISSKDLKTPKTVSEGVAKSTKNAKDASASSSKKLSFTSKTLRKSRVSVAKLSSRITKTLAKKTDPVKNISKKVTPTKESSSDSDSADDIPLNTLATRLVRAKFEPTRRKAFVKSCKATSRNLAIERRSSTDDPETSDTANSGSPTLPVRSLRKRPETAINEKKEKAESSETSESTEDKKSTSRNKRKSSETPIVIPEPKPKRSRKQMKKSLLAKAKTLKEALLRKRSSQKISKSKKKTVRSKLNRSDDKSDEANTSSSQLLSNDSSDSSIPERKHSTEAEITSRVAKPTSVGSNSSDKPKDKKELQKKRKVRTKNAVQKRVRRTLSKNEDPSKLKEGSSKSNINPTRRKNLCRKNTPKHFGVSTLDKNDNDSVPNNQVNGVRVLSYKSLNTTNDLEKVVSIEDSLDADQSLLKPKKRSETHKNSKRKFGESDENFPQSSKITKSRKKSHSQKTSDDSGYLCTECGLTFDSVSSQEDHKLDCTNIALEMSLMVDDHLYECPYCQLTFAMKGTQKKHTTSCRAARKVRRTSKSDIKPNKKRKPSSETTPEISTEPLISENSPVTSDLESIAGRFKNLCLDKLGAPQICSILYSHSMSTSNLRLNLADSRIIDDSTFIWINMNDSGANPPNNNYPLLKMLLEQPVCAGLVQTLYEVMLEMKANSYIRTRDMEPAENKIPPLVVNVSRPELLKALSSIEDFIKEAEQLDMSLKKEQMLKSMRRVFEDDTIS